MKKASLRSVCFMKNTVRWFHMAELLTYILHVKVKLLSRVQLFGTPWTVVYHAPPFTGFSRQQCWSGLPFPSPEDLPDPGIEPGSPAL